MEKTIFTVKEAAAIMRVSQSTLYKLIRENKVPHISFGSRVVVPASQFFDWLDNICVGVL